MKRYTTHGTLTAIAIAAIAIVATPVPNAWAQGTGTPTRAGTKIEAKAKATFTDANQNTLTDSASVGLEVAFKAGVDIAVDEENPTWDSPSSDNKLTYTLTNVSNDSLTFSFDPKTLTSGVSLTGYEIDGGGHKEGDFSDLNADLENKPVDYEGNAGNEPHELEVVLYFDIKGDLDDDETIEIEVDGKNDDDDDGGDDSVTVTIDIETKYGGLSITPEDTTVTPLRGKDKIDFKVAVDEEYSGGEFEIVSSIVDGGQYFEIIGISVDGGQPESSGETDHEIKSGDSVTVTVEYEVDENATGGMTGELEVTVTHKEDGDVTETATADFTVRVPKVSITMEAYRDTTDQNSLNENEELEPGETFWYKITVKNDNDDDGADIKSAEVIEKLPEPVEYKDDAAGDHTGSGIYQWNISYDGDDHEVTATLTEASGDPVLPEGTRATFWVKVEVRDRQDEP